MNNVIASKGPQMDVTTATSVEINALCVESSASPPKNATLEPLKTTSKQE